MAGIFISYRRSDAQWPAGRIFEWLAARVDRSQIFMDVDGIPYGVDFVEELGKRVGMCDALIAVIGPDWATAHDEEGRRRLDDPQDFVRVEIESALRRNVRVIPALIDGARMPKQQDLPFSMQNFPFRNAASVLHATFNSNMENLFRKSFTSLQLAPVKKEFSQEGYAPIECGGYSRESVEQIEGRYLTLRPTFAPPGSIFAYCTEIRWDSGLSRLTFNDLNRTDKAFSHSGHVSAPYQSDAIYFITNIKGKMRLTMLGRPTIDGEMFGLLATLKPEKSSRYTPATCPIAFIPEPRVPVPINYGRLEVGSPEFIYATSILDRVGEEGYATFIKPPKSVLMELGQPPRIVPPRKRRAGVAQLASA